METETQRPKNERTPGGPVGEGRCGSWERAPRPSFRSARPDDFRSAPWREPQAANSRSPHDLGSFNEPHGPQANAAPSLYREHDQESLSAAARPQEAPEEGPVYYPYDSMNPAQSEGSSRPAREEGFNGSNGPDNLDGIGNFAGPSRADGFRPAPWREPQAANPRSPQDAFQAENPRNSEILRSPQLRKKRAPGFFFFLIGGLLLLTAAVFTAINLVEAEQARRATAALIDALPSELSEELSARPSLEAKDSSKRPEPDWPMPQRIVNGEEIIGVIEIPRTGLMLPVLSSWDYDKLKRYPCYYHGSIYRKDAVFCSHDYPFQFGGLNVLEDGDEARFLDADGNIFTYAFREQEYLQPTDVEAMTLKDDWDLTLFTCAYNGLARYAYRFEETGFRAKP